MKTREHIKKLALDIKHKDIRSHPEYEADQMTLLIF
jgi:hypothetical protein|tara:strand:+ start:355 stop:462 length:108 start_codon:yes stop_codon:yes gene_type:complete